MAGYQGLLGSKKGYAQVARKTTMGLVTKKRAYLIWSVDARIGRMLLRMRTVGCCEGRVTWTTTSETSMQIQGCYMYK